METTTPPWEQRRRMRFGKLSLGNVKAARSLPNIPKRFRPEIDNVGIIYRFRHGRIQSIDSFIESWRHTHARAGITHARGHHVGSHLLNVRVFTVSLDR